MGTSCCNNPHLIEYSIKHNPQPIELSTELLECIERLLWYIPGIESEQSNQTGYSQEIITKHLYDEFCFEYILNVIGINPQNAICEDNVESYISDFFEKYSSKLCINCQQLILKRFSNRRLSETRTKSLLRHVRNCIAHGRFNLYGDTMIGFDKDTKGDYTAILKIKPLVLLSALKLLDSGITYENLFMFAFKKLEYTVSPIKSTNAIGDLFISKNNKNYIVEIKNYNSKRHFLNEDIIRNIISHYTSISIKLDINTTIVLIIDTGCLTKSAKNILKDTKIKVLDIRNIENLLSGNDVLSTI